jgi:acetyl esterase/lipase
VDGQTLEPEIQLGVSLLERRGKRRLQALPVAEARTAYSRQIGMLSGPSTPVGVVRDLVVDGATGPLIVRHYAPEEGGGPHPLLVFFHGGGFVLGDLEAHDAPCRLLCRHSGAHVLSVDYRRAPEHPFLIP